MTSWISRIANRRRVDANVAGVNLSTEAALTENRWGVTASHSGLFERFNLRGGFRTVNGIHNFGGGVDFKIGGTKLSADYNWFNGTETVSVGLSNEFREGTRVEAFTGAVTGGGIQQSLLDIPFGQNYRTENERYSIPVPATPSDPDIIGWHLNQDKATAPPGEPRRLRLNPLVRGGFGHPKDKEKRFQEGPRIDRLG